MERSPPKPRAETGLLPVTLCVLGGHDHLCAITGYLARIPAARHRFNRLGQRTAAAAARIPPEPALALRGYACYAYVLPGLYAMKGGLKAAGSAIEWLASQLSPAGGSTRLCRLEGMTRKGVGPRAGPLWLPHLIGSGTPEGDRFSRARWSAHSSSTDRGDLFRGLLESLAFWTRQTWKHAGADRPGIRVHYPYRWGYPAATCFPSSKRMCSTGPCGCRRCPISRDGGGAPGRSGRGRLFKRGRCPGLAALWRRAGGTLCGTRALVQRALPKRLPARFTQRSSRSTRPWSG